MDFLLSSVLSAASGVRVKITQLHESKVIQSRCKNLSFHFNARWSLVLWISIFIQSILFQITLSRFRV